MKHHIAYLFNNQIVNIMKTKSTTHPIYNNMQQLCGGCTENYENWQVCTGLFFSGSQYICYGKQYLVSILLGDWSLFLKTEIPCLVADRYSSQNVISKANLRTATQCSGKKQWHNAPGPCPSFSKC